MLAGVARNTIHHNVHWQSDFLTVTKHSEAFKPNAQGKAVPHPDLERFEVCSAKDKIIFVPMRQA